MKCTAFTLCSSDIMSRSSMCTNRSCVYLRLAQSTTFMDMNVAALLRLGRASGLVTQGYHVCCFSMMLSEKFPPTVISDVHWSGLQLSVTQSGWGAAPPSLRPQHFASVCSERISIVVAGVALQRSHMFLYSGRKSFSKQSVAPTCNKCCFFNDMLCYVNVTKS